MSKIAKLQNCMASWCHAKLHVANNFYELIASNLTQYDDLEIQSMSNNGFPNIFKEVQTYGRVLINRLVDEISESFFNGLKLNRVHNNYYASMSILYLYKWYISKIIIISLHLNNLKRDVQIQHSKYFSLYDFSRIYKQLIHQSP